MKSIVRELQVEALDSAVSVTNLMRKAMVVAKKLELVEFERWISLEVGGYKAIGSIPEYREVTGEVKAWNPYHGWIHVHFATADLNRKLSQRKCGQPISELEHLAGSDPSGVMHMGFAPETEAELMKSMSVPLKPVLEVSPAAIHRILDNARNTILNWSLQLEKDGILGVDYSFSAEEKTNAADGKYNVTNIFGAVSNSQFQQGSVGSSQAMTISPTDKSAISELIDELMKSKDQLGLTPAKLNEIETDLATLKIQIDSPMPKLPILKESLRSLRAIVEGAAGSIASTLLMKMAGIPL